MKFLRDFLDKQKPHFEKGGKWEKFHYVFEAHETLLFTPKSTTNHAGAQIKDAVDMKRMMMTVIIAMLPCLIFGIFNVGHQHHIAIGEEFGFFSLDNLIVGAIKVVPVIVVSYSVGLGIEFLFSVLRQHAVNEGFLVTGMLIPLVMPPDIPLWQVALATAFAVVIGKEAFGGTGMNILNVALTARAFLYFAYPTDMSGDVWTVIGEATTVDGYSGATALAIASEASNTGVSVVESLGASWYSGLFEFGNMLWGAIPGSIGETSVVMALIGAAILVLTGVGSWKIIVSVFGGAYVAGLIFNAVSANTFMAMPAEYHLVMGGLAFGAVFMATDPVTAAQTELGKWIYGFLIGVVTVIIRVVNPAYPEGIMMAILLLNVFAPIIDYYIVQANKKRRLQRATV